MAIPATCDLISTTVMTTGQLYIARVSVVQMLRGSLSLWSALITFLVLGRKLLPYQWTGIGILLVAIIIVGVASITRSLTEDDDESSSSTSASESSEEDSYSEWYYKLIGIVLVLASQIVTAFQIVVEEILLSNVKQPPRVVVGMEGFWGLVLCVFVFIPIFHFLPGDDNDHYEDTHDTFYRVLNSSTLIGFVFLFM